MSQKRSEKSWDEIFAELDAAGPWPDDFLSESERDHRPPQVRPAIEALFDEDNPTKPTAGEGSITSRNDDNPQEASPKTAPDIRHSPNGLPCFPLTGKTFTLEMAKEAEAEQDMKKFERSFAGFPVFPTSDRVITTEIVREAENEMDVEAVNLAPAASAPVARPISTRSIREKRTTRIDPDIYDAVEIELRRQKRAHQRASSTLSDLLDELLRDWLQTHGDPLNRTKE